YVKGRSSGQNIGKGGQFLVEVTTPIVNGAPTPTLNATIEVGPNQVVCSGAVDGSPFVYHHFAMTANGRAVSIYWDGNLVNTADYLGTINAKSDPWISMGADLNNSGPGDPNVTVSGTPLAGDLDDVALWSRSLSGI